MVFIFVALIFKSHGPNVHQSGRNVETRDIISSYAFILQRKLITWIERNKQYSASIDVMNLCVMEENTSLTLESFLVLCSFMIHDVTPDVILRQRRLKDT